MTVRRALVTGGAGTLGRAAAVVLLEHGFHVILADRDVDALNNACDRLGRTDAVQPRLLDVASEESWAALAADLKSVDWSIDMLINNACLPSARMPVFDTDIHSWRRMIDVGLTGAFRGSRAFGPDMVGRRAGYILNVASLAALVPMAHHGDYAAAKAALFSLSESLRIELHGKGVSVSVACPSAIGHAVGHQVDHSDAPAAPGRMDPMVGMGHIIAAALAGDFFIVTHADARSAIASRVDEWLTAFDHRGAAERDHRSGA